VLKSPHYVAYPVELNRPFVALLLALFAGGAAAAPVKALLPAYVESVLGQPPLLTSALLAIQLGCGGLFALAGGAVSDLLSRRAAVLIGLTTALFGAALFTVHHPAVLVGLAALWGIASGFQSTGGQSFMLAAVRRTRLGSATAVYFVSSTASGALGASLAGWGADRFGFGAVTAGAALLALVSLTLAVRFLPALEHGPAGRAAARSGALRHAPASLPLIPARRPPAAAWFLAGYGDLLRRADVLALGALRYFPTVAWGAASLALPLLVFRLSGTTSMVGWFSMASLLAASAAQVLTGRLIDRRARRALSAAGGPAARSGSAASSKPLVAPLAALILLSACLAAIWSESLPGLFVAGTAWAMAAWALSTTMPPLIHELGEGRDDGRLVALTHLLWSAGMLSGTLAAGALVDRHPAAPFALAGACLAVTLAVGLRFPHLQRAPRHAGQPA
jgi:MFS family permease